MFNSDPRIKSFRLSQGKTSLKQLGLILLIALFFIGLAWLGELETAREMAKSENDGALQKPISQAPEVKFFNDKPPRQLDEIPHYEETKKIESFSVKFPDAIETQNIYRFYGAKSGEEIFSLYKDWAEKNGWQIEGAVKEDAYNYQALFITKANSQAWIKINKEGEKTRVSIEMF